MWRKLVSRTASSNLSTPPLLLWTIFQSLWKDPMDRLLLNSLGSKCVENLNGYAASIGFFLLKTTLSIVQKLIWIIHQANQQQPDAAASSKLPHMLLICAFKKSADLTYLDLLLPLSLTSSSHLPSELHLRIEAYVTQDHHQQLDPAQNLIQTTWFKPDPLDSPINPILGFNSWLWLGATIASSFAMFLLLLGIVTRYYIYPIKHGGDGNYHYSYWTLGDKFLMCACVFLASSGVLLWRKKGGAVEGRQVKSVEVPLPTASPGSWLSNAEEREVESLPHQSLVQATNVHFGGRPDLKKILSECKGPDTGVFVCGAREMRQGVAKICASGLGENLHFESISFNW